MSSSRRVIEPTRGWRFLNLRELVHYRELVFFLTWRDVKVRYKQTAIGVAWAILQPLAMMMVFTLFFGKLARIDAEVAVPYPLFAFAGLLPWQLLARTLSETTNSLVTDQRLVTKVYFPRIIVPTSYCLAAVVDFAIGTVLLIGLMFWYGVVPGWAVLALPLFVGLMFITTLGVGYWLSALNTEYRDVMYVVPFLVQFWLFLTPVVYPSSMVPAKFRWLLGLNPMSGVVEGVRWCLLGHGDAPGPMIMVSAVIAVTVFVTGIAWFRWRERTFVDALGGQ